MTRPPTTDPSSRRAPAGPRRRALAGVVGALLWCIYVIGMFGIIRSGGTGGRGQGSLQALFVTSTVIGAVAVVALIYLNVIALRRSGTDAQPAGLVRGAAALSRVGLARLVLTVAALVGVIVLGGQSGRSPGIEYVAVAFFTLLDCFLTLCLAIFTRGTIRLLDSAPAR